MKLKRIILILSFLLVAMIFIGSVSATEGNNLNLTTGSSIDMMSSIDENLMSTSMGDDILQTGKTITVDAVGENHNEMNEKTIQKALDDANDDDTIIINGNNYEHVHRTIDKKLTIKSEVGTVLSPCSSTKDSGYHGIFYLTSKASGTVIEGFNFIGNGMLYGNGDYAILVNGASNVIIRNCTFSDIDSGDAIRLEKANGAIIDNVAVNGAVYGVNIKDSNNVVVENSDIKNNVSSLNKELDAIVIENEFDLTSPTMVSE